MTLIGKRAFAYEPTTILEVAGRIGKIAFAAVVLVAISSDALARGQEPTPEPLRLTPPPPTLTLTFNPQMPSISDNAPLGTVVATVTATWSNGAPFSGTIMFGQPYADDGGTFALSCTQCATANIVVSPTGNGILGDGGTVQQISVVVTQ